MHIYLGLLQNSNKRPWLLKMMSATSASHKTDNSYAFFNSPLRLFANVTCRLILFSILFNSTLPLSIFLLFFSPLSLFLSARQFSVFLSFKEASISFFFFYEAPCDALNHVKSGLTD
jgi:hypothetical protein